MDPLGNPYYSRPADNLTFVWSCSFAHGFSSFFLPSSPRVTTPRFFLCPGLSSVVPGLPRQTTLDLQLHRQVGTPQWWEHQATENCKKKLGRCSHLWIFKNIIPSMVFKLLFNKKLESNWSINLRHHLSRFGGQDIAKPFQLRKSLLCIKTRADHINWQ